LFLIGCFVFFTIIIYNVTKEDVIERVNSMNLKENFRSKKYHITIAALAFLGVAISSFIIIQSILMLSSALNIHEFILSFFILSLGTSLPELSVDINALKKKQYEIAIGDIIGSCIVDATVSIAIGQLFFPQEVSADLAIPAILFTIFASLIVIIVVSLRGKVDKKAGILFISLYFCSYFLLFILI
ncbi:MAG: sodium:calcium antiporter, partial [Promethearchaeota archaeon]